MKTKNLIIIFILFLLITLASGSVVFLTREKKQPVVSEQYGAVERPAEPASNRPAKAAAAAPKQIVEPKKAEAPEAVNNRAEEKIKAVMLINGIKYEAEVKAGSSVYDLMDVLKAENKINFSGKNYSGLGFFVEEINGLKNNPAGENWIYYINGKPAPVGVSYYVINNNDMIEWKYENKSF